MGEGRGEGWGEGWGEGREEGWGEEKDTKQKSRIMMWPNKPHVNSYNDDDEDDTPTRLRPSSFVFGCYLCA